MSQKINFMLLYYVISIQQFTLAFFVCHRPKIWLAIWPLVVTAAISSSVLRQKLDI